MDKQISKFYYKVAVGELVEKYLLVAKGPDTKQSPRYQEQAIFLSGSSLAARENVFESKCGDLASIAIDKAAQAGHDKKS